MFAHIYLEKNTKHISKTETSSMYRCLTLLYPAIVIGHSTAIVPDAEVIIGRQCSEKHRLCLSLPLLGHRKSWGSPLDKSLRAGESRLEIKNRHYMEINLD